MAKKAIVGLILSVSAEKADAVRARVAAHLGLRPADVLVLPGASVTVVDVADPPPPPAESPVLQPPWTGTE